MSEFGKFSSAEELLKGYNELEKSFTQKCQQLSQLQRSAQTTPPSAEACVTDESGTSEVTPSPQQQAVPQQSDGAVDAPTVPLSATPDVPADECASAARPPKVMTGGGNVSAALPNRPKTLKEASELAKKYFV